MRWFVVARNLTVPLFVQIMRRTVGLLNGRAVGRAAVCEIHALATVLNSRNVPDVANGSTSGVVLEASGVAETSGCAIPAFAEILIYPGTAGVGVLESGGGVDGVVV